MTSPTDLTIEALAHGGDAVAHVDHRGERRAVFLARGAPGDRVRATIDFASRPARGRIVELVAPGDGRVTPACADVERCGACDWMHLGREAQAKGHLDLVRGALPAEMREPSGGVHFHEAPETLHYRVRARLHARSERRGPLVIGFNGVGTRDPILVRECHVLHPALETARRELDPLLEGARGRGEIALALGRDGKPVGELRFEGELPATVYARSEQLVGRGAWAGLRIFAGGVTRPAVVGHAEPVIEGADGAPLVLAPGGFSQAHGALNRALATTVAGSVPAGARVLELYAGAGNLTVLLARDRKLTAVESDASACEAARANLRTRGLDAKVTCKDVDELELDRNAEAVVLDPPRTGARAIAAALAAAPARLRRITYVSCDAPTLGRDLALLAPKYALERLELFEMFPQTSHVEIVAVLARKAAGTA
jgi:23S rRNA (uracil1939-C5)-methyltransferase